MNNNFQFAMATIQKYSKYNIQIMKSNKALANILSSIAELILQHRISVKPHFLTHIADLKKEIALTTQYPTQSPQDILYYLVDRGYYDIKQKILAKIKTTALEQLAIVLTFHCTQKVTSLTVITEIWSLQLKKSGELQQDICATIQMMGELIKSLEKQYIFSQIISTPQSKKYIVNYQIDFVYQHKNRIPIVNNTFYWERQCCLDTNKTLIIKCYHGKPLIPILNEKLKLAAPRLKKYSDQTKADSTQIYTIKCEQTFSRRFKSYDQKSSLYETYDEDLNITIISSDNESFELSGSRPRQIQLKEVEEDQFELLIGEQQNQNFDKVFFEDNKQLFERLILFEKSLLL